MVISGCDRASLPQMETGNRVLPDQGTSGSRQWGNFYHSQQRNVPFRTIVTATQDTGRLVGQTDH